MILKQLGEKYHNLYNIYWSDSQVGDFPTINTRSRDYPHGGIERTSYKGKVFCPKTSTGLCVTRRNGKITIQGNTASVGLEVLRSRYERFRNLIERWLVKKIMEPICKIQDFYEYRDGEKKLIVPKIVWNKINLRDIDTYIQSLKDLMATDPGTGKVSDRSVMEFLDLDYDYLSFFYL